MNALSDSIYKAGLDRARIYDALTNIIDYEVALEYAIRLDGSDGAAQHIEDCLQGFLPHPATIAPVPLRPESVPPMREYASGCALAFGAFSSSDF
jgi:hypothetical protein